MKKVRSTKGSGSSTDRTGNEASQDIVEGVQNQTDNTPGVGGVYEIDDDGNRVKV